MITKKIRFFFLVNSALLCSLAVASETAEEHVPSVFDLKWAAVNFIILFSFLIYKLRAPIAKAFKERKEHIEALFNHAAEKHKDAEMKLEIYEGKLNLLDEQNKKVMDDAKTDITKFEQESHEERARMVERINRDAKDKIAIEQQQIMRLLSDELMAAVVAKTKSKIDQSKELKGSLGASLLKKAK